MQPASRDRTNPGDPARAQGTRQATRPNDPANGATASSKVTQPVCRLPLTALYPPTSDVQSRRPAAVLGYGLLWILEAAFGSAGLSVQMVGTTLWGFVWHAFLCNKVQTLCQAKPAWFCCASGPAVE
jgi:hypothetical protein